MADAGRRGPRRWRTPAVTAIIGIAVAAVGVGCSSDGSSTANAAGDASAPIITAADPVANRPATSPPSTTTATGSPTLAPAAPAPVDAVAVLATALDSLSGGYHFDTRVTVEGAEVLVAAGDRVGDGTRLTIWADGGSVAYVITPAASWVLPEGGEWEELDTPPATTDPIAALRAPSAVAVVPPASASPSDPAVTVFAVTVAGTALGIPAASGAERMVTVLATVRDGALVELRYDTPMTDAASGAAVVSALGAVVDATPVVAPI